MISMEMIKLDPHDGVEQGDNHGEDGNCHKLEMLNLGEMRRRWSWKQARRQRYIDRALLLPPRCSRVHGQV